MALRIGSYSWFFGQVQFNRHCGSANSEPGALRSEETHLNHEPTEEHEDVVRDISWYFLDRWFCFLPIGQRGE